MKYYDPLTITHPELERQWHKARNTDLSPDNVTAGSGKSVWWKCPKSKKHVYQAPINQRTQGKGCPICRGLKVIADVNSLAKTHPDLARQWHKTLNKGLLPTEVTAGSGRRAWWKCAKKGHEWEAIIANRCTKGKAVLIALTELWIKIIAWQKQTQNWRKNGTPQKTWL